MATTVEVYSVFISSTSEMQQEREIVAEVVEQINQRSTREGYMLRTLTWENNVAPDMGVRPQSHINKEIGQDYEIFIGVLCSRFGTSTGEYSSGTEEEFSLALERRHYHKDLPKIMFYFRDPRNALERIDAEELTKVDHFKRKISSKGIYKDYQTPEEFRTYLDQHLLTCISQIKALKTPVTIKSTKNDLLAIKNTIDEPGLIDLEEVASEKLLDVTRVLNRLSASQSILITELKSSTDEMKAAQNQKSQSDQGKRTLKRVLTKISSYMDEYTTELASASPQMSKSFAEALRATQLAITISREDGIHDEGDIESIYTVLRSTRKVMSGAHESIGNFVDVVRSLPRMLQTFNHSKRDLANALGRVDKRDSLDLRPVIQALLHVGDELGAQPDI